jgi:hypothetical protein
VGSGEGKETTQALGMNYSYVQDYKQSNFPFPELLKMLYTNISASSSIIPVFDFDSTFHSDNASDELWGIRCKYIFDSTMLKVAKCRFDSIHFRLC